MLDIIAIDWGEKRFGLAFADSVTQLILAADYACTAENIWNILSQEISKRQPKKIVIGRPVNFGGKDTEVTLRVDTFVSELKNRFPTVPVLTVNERNSSKDAIGVGLNKPDKQQRNHLAATKILEYYFQIEHKN